MAKYNTLAELALAFKSGELSSGEWHLMLDNDKTHLSWFGHVPEHIDEAKFWDAKAAEGKALYAGGEGYADVEEAITALGIPCEWV